MIQICNGNECDLSLARLNGYINSNIVDRDDNTLKSSSLISRYYYDFEFKEIERINHEHIILIISNHIICKTKNIRRNWKMKPTYPSISPSKYPTLRFTWSPLPKGQTANPATHQQKDLQMHSPRYPQMQLVILDKLQLRHQQSNLQMADKATNVGPNYRLNLKERSCFCKS